MININKQLNILQSMFETETSLATELVQIVNEDGTKRPSVGKTNYICLFCITSQYGTTLMCPACPEPVDYLFVCVYNVKQLRVFGEDGQVS